MPTRFILTTPKMGTELPEIGVSFLLGVNLGEMPRISLCNRSAREKIANAIIDIAGTNNFSRHC